MERRSGMLDAAMLAPEETEICAGLKVRRMSIGSLDLLCKIASPFADLEKTASGDVAFSATDIARFLYIHGAPLEEVVQTVEREREKLSERATRFAMGIPVAALGNAMKAISGDAGGILAARADAIPDKTASKSKNGRRPAV